MTPNVAASRGRVCWICLGNEFEPDSADAGPFTKLCSCTLQAHESCLLQWMLASRKPAPACPQCGTKFVAVKKRQGLSLIVLGLRQMAAAAAFFGVSFVIFRSVGGAYVRAVYEPEDADRILGVLPIPGLSPLANTIVKAFNSVIVAGIPYVLFRHSRLEDTSVEPPLMSLAMMLMSRLDPQPVGWTSIMFAGMFHSAYRVAMDHFVMPKYGQAPVEVSQVPAFPTVLHMGNDDYDDDVERFAPLPQDREHDVDPSAALSSVQFIRLFEHSRRMNDMMVEVVRTVVNNILVDLGALGEEAVLQARQETPNESDATESEAEDEERAQFNGRQDAALREHIQRNDILDAFGPEQEPLMSESHLLTMFLVVNADATADDFHDWSTDYTNMVRYLVGQMRDSGMTASLDELMELEVWKMIYWQPIRFLASRNSREQRVAILVRAGPTVLEALSSFVSSDRTTWDHAQYEHLLERNTDGSTAEYICEWIEYYRAGIHDPLHNVFVNEVINDIAEIDPEAAALVGERHIMPFNADAGGHGAVAPQVVSSVIEWEQAAPILLHPFCSMFVSRSMEKLWPFSLLSILNRNLVAGGLVILINDLARIALAILQYRSRKKWYLMRFDDLDEETRQLVELQQNLNPV